MIEAIKKKQADIKRLEREIQQLREALDPKTSYSHPSSNAPYPSP
jgi:hypothetical protein